MKSLLNYISEDIWNNEDEDAKQAQSLDGGVDIAVVGEIRLYSERNDIFKERKRAIARRYRQGLKKEEANSARIESTPIITYYIRDLINWYKKDVDENIKLNISSRDDLIRQITNDIILLVRDENSNII